MAGKQIGQHLFTDELKIGGKRAKTKCNVQGWKKRSEDVGSDQK